MKDFNNMSYRSQSEWIDFGFCFCRNSEWMLNMVSVYLELASKASFADIASCWEF